MQHPCPKRTRSAFSAGPVSAFEERYQRGNEDVVSYAVVLTGKAAMLRIGEDAHERLRPMMHECRARSTIHHERRYRDRGPLPDRQRVATRYFIGW
jgi:hypothetical protein